VWGARVRALCVVIRPRGEKTFYFAYSLRGRTRFYRMAPSTRFAKRVKLLIARAADGHDPRVERREQATADTFEQLLTRYVAEHARRHNKSWRQSERLIKTYVLPRWQYRLGGLLGELCQKPKGLARW
jgi:hypothetical protein